MGVVMVEAVSDGSTPGSDRLLRAWQELDVPEGQRAEILGEEIRLVTPPSRPHNFIAARVPRTLLRSLPDAWDVYQTLGLRAFRFSETSTCRISPSCPAPRCWTAATASRAPRRTRRSWPRSSPRAAVNGTAREAVGLRPRPGPAVPADRPVGRRGAVGHPGRGTGAGAVPQAHHRSLRRGDRPSRTVRPGGGDGRLPRPRPVALSATPGAPARRSRGRPRPPRRPRRG